MKYERNGKLNAGVAPDIRTNIFQLYTVGHKKHAILFCAITSVFLDEC